MVLHGSPADRLVEKKRPIREYETLGGISEGWVSMTPEQGEIVQHRWYIYASERNRLSINKLRLWL